MKLIARIDNLSSLPCTPDFFQIEKTESNYIISFFSETYPEPKLISSVVIPQITLEDALNKIQ
jgi:hypothetical protein